MMSAKKLEMSCSDFTAVGHRGPRCDATAKGSKQMHRERALRQGAAVNSAHSFQELTFVNADI